LAELSATTAMIAEDSPRTAERLSARVFDIITRLADAELEGPEVVLRTGQRARSWPVPPFRIYYRRTPSELVVLRIYHHARQPLTK
jgi:plasmid stabilization system protein ParE